MICEKTAETVAMIQELESLANQLGMPDTERRSILGLSEVDYDAWYAGIPQPVTTPPELIRRLGYAIPLMRRMVANTRPLPDSSDKAASLPCPN